MLPEEKITFNSLPEAVQEVLEEVRSLKATITQNAGKAAMQERDKHVLVDIRRASEITLKAESTLYSYVRNREIPFVRSGRRVLFYEDELETWLESGKCQTLDELSRETEARIIAL